MSPTLYHVPRTISSPIVQTLLELDLVPSLVEIKTLTFADLKSPGHLAINPMGTSPAFRDGDKIMWESGAVMTWILEKYDTQYKLHPPQGTDDAKRIKFLHLHQYIIATVYPFIASLFIHTLRPAQEQDPEYVVSAKSKWRELLGPTLTTWLGDGPYFLGESLSAVDLLVAKPLYNVMSLGMLQEFPTLHHLFERIQSRPTFAKAYSISPAEEPKDSDEPSERSLRLVPSTSSDQA